MTASIRTHIFVYPPPTEAPGKLEAWRLEVFGFEIGSPKLMGNHRKTRSKMIALCDSRRATGQAYWFRFANSRRGTWKSRGLEDRGVWFGDRIGTAKGKPSETKGKLISLSVSRRATGQAYWFRFAIPAEAPGKFEAWRLKVFGFEIGSRHGAS